MVAHYTTVDDLRTKVIQAVSNATARLRSSSHESTVLEALGKI
jgi:hypothetical protein